MTNINSYMNELLAFNAEQKNGLFSVQIISSPHFMFILKTLFRSTVQQAVIIRSCT